MAAALGWVRSRPARRRFAVVLVLVLALAGGLFEVAAAAQPQAVPVCPAERADEAAALAAARSCGGQVRVADATTETSMTLANPDGSLSARVDAGPTRFLRDGAWVDIDADLHRAVDGTVSAQAHPAGLELFGGDTPATLDDSGDRPLVTIETPDETTAAGPAASAAGAADSIRADSISLDWQGGLPKPVLDGDTATYPEAKPGVDLVVQMTATGFQQHTILKIRPTKPVSVTLPIKLDGLTARRGPGGAVAGTMPAPSMWDSRRDAVSQLPVQTVPVQYTLTTRSYGVDVVLTPDMTFLTDPVVQYPVTIDPDIGIHGTFDTSVRRDTTTDMSAATELVIGADGSGDPARSFLNWNPQAIRGKKVVQAHLGLWNSYSSTCATRAIDVRSAGAASTGTRWAAQPSMSATVAASTVGVMACPSNPTQGYIYTPPHALDALVQSWADTTSGAVGLALVAPVETDVFYFKRVRSGDATSGQPFVYVTYVTIPPVSGCQEGGDGDVNGDGKRDTAIADPEYTVDGRAKAGAVHVVDGATGAVTTLRQGRGGIPDSPQTGDQFGSSLAMYDTNLDGCTDLAIGAPFEDSGSIVDSGAVFIVYGAPGGLGSGRATVVVEQGKALAEGRGTVPDALEANDWFGYALSAGRTAIGEPYLIVGAPGEDLGAAQDTGLVHYLRDTLNITLDLVAAGAGAAANDDRSGYALASTPYHIAIGRPGAKAAGETEFAGSACLFTQAFHGDPPRALRCLDQGAAGVGGVAEAGDQFGKALAMVPYRPAGTAAGVANSLLVVGAPGEDVGAVDDAGQVQQFLLTQTDADQLAVQHQDSAGVNGSIASGDYFGEQIAAVNLKPAAEASPSTVLVAVGAPGEDSGDVVDAGVVHVFGAGAGTVTDDVTLRRSTGSLPGAPIEQELLGAWLSGTPQHLMLPSPYGPSQAVYAIRWTALAAGTTAPSVTYRPGAGGLPANGVAFGTAIG